MIRPTPEPHRLERRMARDLAVPYADAPELFEALWTETRDLDRSFPRARDLEDVAALETLQRELEP